VPEEGRRRERLSRGGGLAQTPRDLMQMFFFFFKAPVGRW